MLVIWSLVPLPFLNPPWTSGSSQFTYVLLMPSLKDFEHNLANMWNEWNCIAIWTFFGIAFLWDWNENWPFPVLWPLLGCPNLLAYLVQFSSVHFSRSVMSNSLRPHEPQHTRPPCPSPAPRVHPNPRPLSRCCHPTISSSVVPFSSCPQSFPASSMTLQQHHLRIWISSARIPSPPLVLLVAVLPKAYLTSHLKMSCSRSVTTSSHRGYLGHYKVFCTVLLCILVTSEISVRRRRSNG